MKSKSNYAKSKNNRDLIKVEVKSKAYQSGVHRTPYRPTKKKMKKAKTKTKTKTKSKVVERETESYPDSHN